MPTGRIDNFAAQLRRNAVALISLVVAISALGYTTWRNELTEHNRNVRAAGFEILAELAELQLIVDFRHYDADPEAGNPIRGWASIIMIRELSRIMPPEVRERAGQLYATWDSHWQGLGARGEDVEAITGAIEQSRDAVLAALDALE